MTVFLPDRPRTEGSRSPLRSVPGCYPASPRQLGERRGASAVGFVRILSGLPLGAWSRLSGEPLVLGSALGLPLGLYDPTLAPRHLSLRLLDDAEILVESLCSQASFTLGGQMLRYGIIDSPCLIGVGKSVLQLYPPSNDAEGIGRLLQALRSWMRPDPMTHLPFAGGLRPLMEQQAAQTEPSSCLVVARPRSLNLESARLLRRTLCQAYGVCRLSPTLFAALTPRRPLRSTLSRLAGWTLHVQECAGNPRQIEEGLRAALWCLAESRGS